VAVHRLKRVRSLRWSAAQPDVVAANGRRSGVVIVGDDWEVTVSAADAAVHLPYLSRLLELT
jgi:hypothetical protein